MAMLTRNLLFSLLTISLLSSLLYLLPPPPTLPNHDRHFSLPSNLAIPYPPPPRIAYFISGTDKDGPRIFRLLQATYHPRNHYLLHLDRGASKEQREELAQMVGSVQVFVAADNVNVIEKANSVREEGSTPLALVLHGRYQRIMEIVVDPGLYLISKGRMFTGNKKRILPNAYRFYTGSPHVILSRSLLEFSILGWDNLPRKLLLFFSNTKYSHRHYFQTLACNSKEFSKTVVNSNLRFTEWIEPSVKEPRFLRLSDLEKMLSSGAAFAGKFAANEPVLDEIDSLVLHKRAGMISPGGWCLGRRGRGRDPCQLWGDMSILRPGPAAKTFEKLLLRLMANTTFYSH